MELANDCAYGLGSYCFSASQARADRIGRQLRTGMFVANDYASNGMCQALPFGGVKESGFGRCGATSGWGCVAVTNATCCLRCLQQGFEQSGLNGPCAWCPQQHARCGTGGLFSWLLGSLV